MNLDEVILDRSPAQIERFISESRIAIIRYGYSIVRTAWLHQTFERMDKDKPHENANTRQAAPGSAEEGYAETAR